MNNRVRQLWLPGLLTFIMSMGLLALTQIFGPKPWILSWGRPPVAVIFIPWLLALPLVGAVGAFLSHRAGGSRRGIFFFDCFSRCSISRGHFADQSGRACLRPLRRSQPGASVYSNGGAGSGACSGRCAPGWGTPSTVIFHTTTRFRPRCEQLGLFFATCGRREAPRALAAGLWSSGRGGRSRCSR
jgi:hypothetical protein